MPSVRYYRAKGSAIRLVIVGALLAEGLGVATVTGLRAVIPAGHALIALTARVAREVSWFLRDGLRVRWRG